MAFATKRAAEKFGREHTPAGWRYETHNNFGWHVRWCNGPISVFQSEAVEGDFLCSISPCLVNGYGKSVLGAARTGSAAFRKYAEQQRSLLDKIEKGIVEALGKEE